jgi:hypothetical protein
MAGEHNSSRYMLRCRFMYGRKRFRAHCFTGWSCQSGFRGNPWWGLDWSISGGISASCALMQISKICSSKKIFSIHLALSSNRRDHAMKEACLHVDIQRGWGANQKTKTIRPSYMRELLDQFCTRILIMFLFFNLFLHRRIAMIASWSLCVCKLSSHLKHPFEYVVLVYYNRITFKFNGFSGGRTLLFSIHVAMPVYVQTKATCVGSLAYSLIVLKWNFEASHGGD